MTGKGTTRRSIRVPGEEWDPFVANAANQGTDASTKIRAWIREDNNKNAPIVGKDDEGGPDYQGVES